MDIAFPDPWAGKIVQHLASVAASDLYTLRPCLASLSPAKLSCPGLYGETWQKAHANMLDLLDRFGTQAVELAWPDLDLFSVHPGTAQPGRIAAVPRCKSPQR